MSFRKFVKTYRQKREIKKFVKTLSRYQLTNQVESNVLNGKYTNYAPKLLISSGLITVSNETLEEIGNLTTSLDFPQIKDPEIMGMSSSLFKKASMTPYSQEYYSEVIEKHFVKKWGLQVYQNGTKKGLILDETDLIDGLGNVSLDLKELGLKMNLNLDETIQHLRLYTKSRAIRITQGKFAGKAQRFISNGFTTAMTLVVGNAVDVCQVVGLTGKEILHLKPMLGVAFPTVLGLTLRAINIFLPQHGIASNITLFFSDVAYIPAWVIQTTWNTVVAAPLTKCGLPFVGMNVTGNIGLGWEAGYYLAQNTTFRDKTFKLIAEGLIQSDAH